MRTSEFEHLRWEAVRAKAGVDSGWKGRTVGACGSYVIVQKREDSPKCVWVGNIHYSDGILRAVGLASFVFLVGEPFGPFVHNGLPLVGHSLGGGPYRFQQSLNNQKGSVADYEHHGAGEYQIIHSP